MSRILLILCFLFIAMYSDAQNGSWKIKLNSKIVLSTNREDENANIKKVTAAEWKKSGSLEIIFTENDPDTWVRSFLFFDTADNQLFSRDSTAHAVVSISSLRKVFTGKKEIRIYTIISPLDPNIAIRMRRVHLCTLKLP